MDEVFKALADPGRRLLLDSLNARNGQTLHELCLCLDMARQSVSKHLAVLEHANLVTTVWRGREKLHYLNAAPINEIADRWISRYDRQRVHALSNLKKALEANAMTKPEFVYTAYIRTTPDVVWRGLTDPAFTRQYWGGVAFETDWKPGSTMTVVYDNGVRIADPEQTVLVSDPYRKLSYTWHTFTPEWAEVNGISAEQLAAFAAERRSKVTFDIEDLGDLVKLTVTHDDFEPGGVVRESCGVGWPRLVSDLKTLLEKAPVASLSESRWLGCWHDASFPAMRRIHHAVGGAGSGSRRDARDQNEIRRGHRLQPRRLRRASGADRRDAGGTGPGGRDVAGGSPGRRLPAGTADGGAGVAPGGGAAAPAEHPVRPGQRHTGQRRPAAP